MQTQTTLVEFNASPRPEPRLSSTESTLPGLKKKKTFLMQFELSFNINSPGDVDKSKLLEYNIVYKNGFVM